MKWFVILNLAVLVVSLFFYLRALFRWFRIKWYFQNKLPYRENECIRVFPRYPLWYYRMCSTPWYNRIAEDLVKRNQILMKYDREKAEQLILAEKQMFWFWSTGALATGIIAFYLLMK